jgi:serine/threonine protein kinase
VAGQDAADGTPFGRYRLVALLGRGGMGEVWRAFDTDTDRIVALKLLPPYLSEDEDFQRRFRREAHAAAQLNDPHVIPIHYYGEIDGRLYVDMRLIEGRDLDSVLADGPLDPARAVRIIDQVAKALHAAHEVGLLHRDIKPSNILLGRDDFAYLIDFGIACAADETRMTKSGNTIGTFAYIAPKRLDPHTEEDARADIYSLACVLYEALTGEPPFAGVSRKMRSAVVIRMTASGSSTSVAVSADTHRSWGPAVITSNHASQISNTPVVNAVSSTNCRRRKTSTAVVTMNATSKTSNPSAT